MLRRRVCWRGSESGCDGSDILERMQRADGLRTDERFRTHHDIMCTCIALCARDVYASCPILVRAHAPTHYALVLAFLAFLPSPPPPLLSLRFSFFPSLPRFSFSPLPSCGCSVLTLIVVDSLPFSPGPAFASAATCACAEEKSAEGSIAYLLVSARPVHGIQPRTTHCARSTESNSSLCLALSSVISSSASSRSCRFSALSSSSTLCSTGRKDC